MAGGEEFPPLLVQGFHHMGLTDLGTIVVDGFPLSKRRAGLWKCFCELVAEISLAGFSCEIWVDGSFLTEKIEPDDVDFVVDIPIETIDTLSSVQAALIEKIKLRDSSSIRRQKNLHGFVMITAPPGNSFHGASSKSRAQWVKDFGFSYETNEPKGIAIIGVYP